MKCPHCNKNKSWFRDTYLYLPWKDVYCWTREKTPKELGLIIRFAPGQRPYIVHEIFVCGHCWEAVS